LFLLLPSSFFQMMANGLNRWFSDRKLPKDWQDTAQVLLAWAVQRGTALLTTPKTAARARENFDISALPEEALDEINRIRTRQRLNEVVSAGVPGSFPAPGQHESQTAPWSDQCKRKKYVKL
jgi:hypothetical protein